MQFALKLHRFRHQSRQGRGAIDRNRWPTLAVWTGLVFGNAGNLSQLPRSILNRIHATVQTPQLLLLLFIFSAQPLVLMFDAQMRRLLRQAVKTVEQTAGHGHQPERRRFEPAFVHRDSFDM